MKKLLTFFTMALLAFSVGWAAEVTFDATTDKGSVTANGTVSGGDYVTKDGITVTSSNGPMGNGANYRVYTNGTLTVTSTVGNITKIEMTFTASGTNQYGPSKLSATGYSYSGYVGTWQGTAATTVTFNATAQARITNIVVTVSGGATVTAPTISPSGGNFGGSQVVTISHDDADAIYYTTNGDEPTTSSTLYTAPFTIYETTTVKAIAVKNGVSSSPATATFNEAGVGTIAAAYALAQNSQFVFTGNAVVTYQNGPNIWIRDNSGSGMIYGYNLGNYVNGDILDAGWSATNTTYQQVIRQFSSASGLSSSSNGGTVDPVDKTTTGVTNANIHEYVSFSHFTTTWDSSVGYRYITIDNHNIYLKDQFSQGFTFINGKYYDIEGIVYIDTQNNNNTIVYLTKVTEAATTEPQLIASPDELTFNDSGTGNTFTVEGSNLGGDNVGLTQNGSYFTPTLTATTGWATNGGSFWYLSPDNGSLNGTVAMSYTGTALSASETVTLANNMASATVTVNYRADLYIVGNFGSGWDFSTGTPMTYNATDNTYTASVTVDAGNLILFARKYDSNDLWGTRYVFGPNSTGDCWVSGDFTGTIDLNDDDPIYFNSAGTYVIEINATTGALTITKEVVNTGDFELVTNVNDLVAGNEVIIVNSGTAGTARTMGQRNNNNYYGTEVTVTTTQKVTATETTQIFTLEAGTGGWYFKTSDNLYLNSTTGTSNQLQTKAKDGNGSGTSLAAISISNDIATIVFQGQGSRKNLRYNANGITTNPSNNDIFSCYQSGSQDNVYIYQRTASVQEPSITVNPSSLELVIPVGSSSVDGAVTVTETNTTGTTSVSINGDTNIFSASLSNGTLTVTYSGTANVSNPDEATITLTNGTATATVTVTGYKRVEATGTLYTKVTSADQIQDGLKYILVYEGTPEALNGITSGGTGAAVTWETQGSVVNIGGTDVIEFTLNGNASGFTLSSTHGYLNPGSAPNLTFGTEGETWSAESNNGGYVLKYGNYMMRYNSNAGAANGRFRIYDGTTGTPVYLYVQGETAGVATPVITPASGNYAEDQEVSIACSTTGATIYYTINGGDTQTYSEPFNVDVDEEHTSTTIVAWAVKNNVTSEQATVTYTYKSDHISSIEEFLALAEGDSAIFDNPVVVLFDYSQNSGSGQEYIWVKDRTGYTQFFIAPQFDAESVADPQYNGTYGQFVPKYENGDVIPAGFKVKKAHYSTGDYYQGQCYATHSSFQIATEKALADPEQVLLSELLAAPATYNNRYLYINKLKVSDIDGLNFRIAADENDDNVAEIQGGTAIVGYNKYNSPAWKNKQGQIIGVTVPTDGEYYNVKFIFQKWSQGYEIMPIEFIPWVDNSLRLEDLVEVGVENNTYTISNQLHAAAVTWDDNYGKFAIFAKDDEMYANKRFPTDGQETYLIRYENVYNNVPFINTVEQENYDQSNWIEILIPSEVTNKVSNSAAYTSELDRLKGLYVNQILKAGSIIGVYKDALNPTIEVTSAPIVDTESEYTPNIYCTANFIKENLDADGAYSNRDGNYYFMMDAKPHEFCKVVWAYFQDVDNYFVAPIQQGDQTNGHNFRGFFMADMSLCEDADVVSSTAVTDCFDASNKNGDALEDVTLYGFNAVVRKNPAYWSNTGNGAPRRVDVLPNNDGRQEEGTPAYIVYPLNAGATSSDNVVSVKEILGNKAIESVHYYNTMGMESKTPFEGINIVVTRYTDGSTSTIKVMK